MRHKGFTLIELIIVIVILGILAVTAAPRFINLSSDASASTLQGVKAALQSGSQLVYAKSAIAGVQNNANTLGSTVILNNNITGITVSTHYGYPDAENATENAGPDSVANWMQLDFDNDFVLVVGSGATDEPPTGSFMVAPGTVAPDYSSDNCHVLYSNSTGPGVAPQVTVVDNGC